MEILSALIIFTFGAIIGVILAVHVITPLLGLKGLLLVGAAIDLGKTDEAYWQPLFKGYDFSKPCFSLQ